MSSRRYRILFITKWYPNRYDPQLGVFIYKHALAVSKFCDVALLYVCQDDMLRENKTEIEVKKEGSLYNVIVYFKKYKSAASFVNSIVNFTRYLLAVKDGLNYIRKNFGDHDITQAYILLRPALVAYCIQLFRGKPFVISEQWSGYATGKFEQKNSLEKALSKFIFRKAKAVTAVSEFLKNHMTRNGLQGNYTIIPNIIETSTGQAAPRTGDAIRILSVADLVDEIKNISGTLKAFAEVSSVYPGIEFHVVGDGRDRAKLEKMSADLGLLNSRVFFHGLKSNEEVYRQLENCDFLMMNSNFETFSLICAEAMSCGKPVLATRCGGPEEFVTPETGVLIEPGNHEQLVRAMQAMCSNYSTYSAEKLKKYVGEKFSDGIAGEKYLKLYTTILPH